MAEDVERLRRLVGLDFPPELRAWWDRVEAAVLPDGYVPLGVRGAEEEYRRQAEFADQDCCDGGTHRKPAGATSFPYCTALVPIGQDIGGGMLCVDLRDGAEHGRIMQWDAEEGCYASRWASLAALPADA